MRGMVIQEIVALQLTTQQCFSQKLQYLVFLLPRLQFYTSYFTSTSIFYSSLWIGRDGKEGMDGKPGPRGKIGLVRCDVQITKSTKNQRAIVRSFG